MLVVIPSTIDWHWKLRLQNWTIHFGRCHMSRNLMDFWFFFLLAKIYSKWKMFKMEFFSWIRLQSISEFLKNLPSHNEKNFALFNTENGIRTSSRRPSVYLPTVDIPSEQSKQIFLFFIESFHYVDTQTPFAALIFPLHINKVEISFFFFKFEIENEFKLITR